MNECVVRVEATYRSPVILLQINYFFFFFKVGSCPGTSKRAYGILRTNVTDCVDVLGGSWNPTNDTWINCHLDFCRGEIGE